MLACLRAHALLRLEQVAVRRPGVRRAARDFVVAEVRRRGAAVLCCQVKLLRDLVVQHRDVVQFQTLTSR
jgi:hypothetical protein